MEENKESKTRLICKQTPEYDESPTAVLWGIDGFFNK